MKEQDIGRSDRRGEEPEPQDVEPEPPSLDVPAWRPEWERRQQAAASYDGSSSEAMATLLDELRRPADAPRARVWRDEREGAPFIEKRTSRYRALRHFGGLVELVGWSWLEHDFRVRLEVVETDAGPKLECTGLAIIPREGGLNAVQVRDAKPGAAIAEAVKLLSVAVRLDEDGQVVGRDEAPSGAEVRATLPRDERPEKRRSSATVSAEIEAAARYVAQYQADHDGASPTGKELADALGMPAKLAYKRLSQARRKGLLAPVPETDGRGEAARARRPATVMTP